jgi:hypothetical protein
MALQAEQIIDLVTTTQKNLGRMKWTDLTSTLHNYVALPKILVEKKVGFQSGTAIQFNVQMGTSGAARNVGLGQSDQTNIGDTMKTATVPWRHQNTNYGFFRQEIRMNSGPEQIVELVKTRRHDAMVDLAKLFEANFWSKPVDSTDSLKPFGVPYWIVPSATTGLFGLNPSGFSDGAGGLSSTTYDQWRNLTAQYAAVTKADLIKKLRLCYTKANFKSPISPAPPSYADGSGWGIYSGYDNVLSVAEEMLEAQNDNLGNDVASRDGAVTFRRIPWEWVDYLDSDATNPVCGINWATFKPFFLEGEYMVENPPEKVSGQHTTFRVDVDCTHNYVCYNRRENFWICTA